MNAMLLYAVLTLPAFGMQAPQDGGPTRANIPADLSPELKELIERTFSADPSVRGESAHELGELGERAAPAVPFLIRLLNDHAFVRYQRGIEVGHCAGAAIAKIGQPALDPLLAALKRASGEMRLEIISRLGYFKGYPRALDALIAAVGEGDRESRHSALYALLDCTNPRIIDPVAKVLKEDADPEERAAAAWVLEDVRDPRAVDALLGALKDKDASVRSRAADSLGRQGDRRAVPALLEMLQNAKEDESPRGSAALALGRIGDRRALEPLVAVLKDRRLPEDLRCAAAFGLGGVKERRAGEVLTAVLKDTADLPGVRAETAMALGKAEGERAIALLTEVAKSEGEVARVRFWAAMTVVEITGGAIEDADVVKPLIGYVDRDEVMTAYELRQETQRKALEKILERGKTEAVRSEAKKILRALRGETGGAGIGTVIVVLAVSPLVVVVGLCAWRGWHHRRLPPKSAVEREGDRNRRTALARCSDPPSGPHVE